MNSKNEPQTLGEYLRVAREGAGYSMRQLARLAEIDYSFLTRIESGERTPAPEYLQRLADALGVDVTEFLAFLGVKPAMPEPRVYFRRKLGVDADEAEIMAQLIEDYQAKKKGEKE